MIDESGFQFSDALTAARVIFAQEGSFVVSSFYHEFYPIGH
jgi:hypothetical protein